MSKNTRYSHLLFHVMSPELREEFFTNDEENFDAGWDLFETLHPEKAGAGKFTRTTSRIRDKRVEVPERS